MTATSTYRRTFFWRSGLRYTQWQRCYERTDEWGATWIEWRDWGPARPAQ